MNIKVNHITNLHDSRFCAAEDVKYISFSLEKGHIRKVSIQLIKDIIEWLSGPIVVIDFGSDLQSLLDFVSDNNYCDYVQVDLELLSQNLPIPSEKIIVTIGTPDIVNWVEIKDKAAFFEIPNESTTMNNLLRFSLVEPERLFYFCPNIDFTFDTLKTYSFEEALLHNPFENKGYPTLHTRF